MDPLRGKVYPGYKKDDKLDIRVYNIGGKFLETQISVGEVKIWPVKSN